MKAIWYVTIAMLFSLLLGGIVPATQGAPRPPTIAAPHGTALALYEVASIISTQSFKADLVGHVGGPATALAVQGNYAYLCIDGGLVILNIADRAHPLAIGHTSTLTSAIDVAVAGSYAYVADGGSGLRIVNIANPASPTEVGAYDTPGTALAVTVAGSYAYVADGGSGLRIVNIANPASPTEVGFSDIGPARDVAVASSYAYVADGASGLRIVNIATPSSPAEVGFYTTATHAARDVAVAGSYSNPTGAIKWEGNFSRGLRPQTPAFGLRII
jgi:hypothetical protein